MRTVYVVEKPLLMISPSLALDWRALYHAAIFEDDKSKIAERVAAAENALHANVSLLADKREGSKELQDMERAMYFLRLLGKQGMGLNTIVG
jgi:hypothetical protein